MNTFSRNDKATSKKIVKASLLALSDPDLEGSDIPHTIYALAIKHRLDRSSMDDVAEGEVGTLAPSIKTKGTAKVPANLIISSRLDHPPEREPLWSRTQPS
jgi:hypothetical protein